MKKVLLFTLCIIICLICDSLAADYKYRGGGSGVITAADCSTYIAIGQLCQNTGDGKLYKGTGAAVEEIASGSALAASDIVAYTADASPTSDDLVITVNAPGTTPALRKVTLANLQTYILGGATTVATDAIFDTSGDLVQGTGANTSEKLAIGTAYQILMVNSGATKAAWTSTLGATGTRLTYGYFTDLAVTNAVQASVTGTAAGLSGTPNITIGTLNAGGGGMTVDADGDVVAKSITISKVSGTAGLSAVYEANSTDTDYVAWMGAASISESWSYQFSSTQPTAGQIMLFGAPAGTGDPNGKKISAQTWGLPALRASTIDGSAHVHLTAAQMSTANCRVSNYGQTTADVSIGLPTAAADLSCLFEVETARSNHWGVLADTNDNITIIAAAGTIGSAGTDGAAVVMLAAQVGQSFACWTHKTGESAWDWKCKAIAIGTSTFEAHAAY